MGLYCKEICLIFSNFEKRFDKQLLNSIFTLHKYKGAKYDKKKE